MNFINDKDFPIVFVNIEHNKYKEHSHNDDFKDFEKLVSRQEKFILINEGGTPDTDFKHSREEIKMVNNFLRTNRAKLKEFAVAMIQVEPSSLKRLAYKPFQNIFEKFWGMKLLIVSNLPEAIQMANNLLTKAEQTSK
ncbi:hypothetical protein MKJ01_18150 [Chryseobacterium sp. SSA4.19]|uniref:hypothetical protein n=1 Tax=Chryseobacterium sp. SSA4.19 TaxID=2919915 RepID=UPI001F4E3FEC|nr:hypothetical protein [Chryseobacterium sp. SSA4.19]MCJ8155680.1 hypothetical protein [Chryseobacterium sp. SSA4.19]